MQQQIALDIPVCPETPTKLFVKRHLLLARDSDYYSVSICFIRLNSLDNKTAIVVLNSIHKNAKNTNGCIWLKL